MQEVRLYYVASATFDYVAMQDECNLWLAAVRASGVRIDRAFVHQRMEFIQGMPVLTLSGVLHVHKPRPKNEGVEISNGQ